MGIVKDPQQDNWTIIGNNFFRIDNQHFRRWLTVDLIAQQALLILIERIGPLGLQILNFHVR